MPETLEFNPLENVMPSFITPIGRFSRPGHDAFDRELASAVLRRAAQPQEPDARRGGWRSGEDILNWPEPALAQLAGHVRSALGHMILLARDGEEYTGIVRLSAWARLHEAGVDWPLSHHPRSHWTALYFPAIDLHPDHEGGPAGELIFQDPRGSAINMMPHPGASGAYGALTFTPTPGLLLVFPAWLQYRLSALDNGQRIVVVGFNALLAARGEASSPIALA